MTSAPPRGWSSPLLAWYDAYKRDFPWRKECNPYHSWICEVMSQQTTMAVVVPRFVHFVEVLPTVDHLASCDEDTLRSLWSGLGYYARARNLRKGAEHIVTTRAGRFPTSYAGWLEVPGVGPYTASVIASITCHEPVACVDGNVVRVVGRLLALHDESSVWSVAGQRRIQEFAQGELIASEGARARPGDFNQAIMELGATLCTKHSPQCPFCPIQASCAAQERGLQQACPPPKPRKAKADVALEALCLVRKVRGEDDRLTSEVLLAVRGRGFLKGTLGWPLVDQRHFADSSSTLLPDIALVPSGTFSHTITNHALSGVTLVGECCENAGSLVALEGLLREELKVHAFRWCPASEVRSLLSSSLDLKAWQCARSGLACQNPG